MLRLRLVWVPAVVGMALLVGLAQVQPGDAPPPGEGGHGMPPGMGRGMMGPGGGMIALLNLEPLQKELNLTDEQKEKIKELAKEMRPPRRSEGEGPSPDERRTMMEKAQKKLAEILKPEQLQRLKEIQLQAMGPAALGNPQVVKALGITDEQGAKIKTLLDEGQRKRRELFGSMRDLLREDRREKMAENQGKLRQIQKELMDKALAVLTPEQREKFRQAQGQEVRLGFFRPDAASARAARLRRELTSSWILNP